MAKLLILGVFFACASLSRPRSDIEYAHRIAPLPSQYFAWWRKTEECSGIKGRMRVPFYIVPKATFRIDTATFALHLIGLYVRDTADAKRIVEKIYIAAPWVFTEWLVRHEMLHALLNRDSTVGGHPLEYFEAKCDLMPGPWRRRADAGNH